MRSFFKYTLISAIAFSISGLANGQKSGGKSASIESVIDKLERKLVEETGDRISIYNATRKTEDKAIEISGSDVVGSNLKEMASIKDFENEVSTLENSLSKLSDSVANVAQEIIADANQDTTSQLFIDMASLTKYNLKKMEISLNGHPLFKFDASYHVMLPVKTIPLYDGPLAVGEHMLQVTGSFNQLLEDEISIESEVYAGINESIPLEIKPEEKTTSFKVMLSAATTKSIKAALDKKVFGKRKLGGLVDNSVKETILVDEKPSTPAEESATSDTKEELSTVEKSIKKAIEEEIAEESKMEEKAKESIDTAKASEVAE